MLEYVIVGGGPAGIQVANYLQQSGKQFVVLEKLQEPGGFFRKYPLHRTLISVNKVSSEYPRGSDITFRWDWNSLLSEENEQEKFLFSELSKDYFAGADYMTEYCTQYAKRWNLPVITGVTVQQISKHETSFKVQTNDSLFHTKKVIIATGNNNGFTPDIPGIHLTSNYTNIIHDSQFYLNKRVLIIGKGNTGMETANMMTSTAASVHMISPSPMKFAWDTNFPGNVRAVNMTFLDSCLLSRENSLLNGTVHKIIKQSNGKYSVSISDQYGCNVNEYDEVINCTGFCFDTSIFHESCQPNVIHENRYPQMTDWFESTNVQGMYFAGALTASRDFKVSSSAFIHGFRYNSRALARYLNIIDSKIPWSCLVIPCEPYNTNTFVHTAKRILQRAETSSALWHLLGVMSDVFCVPRQTQKNVLHYHEIPCGMWNSLGNILDITENEYLLVRLVLEIKQQNKKTTFIKKNRPHAKVSLPSGEYLCCFEDHNGKLANDHNLYQLASFLFNGLKQKTQCRM